MPNSIDAYYQSLLSLIADSPIIRASNISLDKRASRAGLIRGDLYFVDSSRLHFRELVELQDVVVRRMYSYHYQSADALLIFRYDDTFHFPDLPDFPHHKHIGHENEVISAKPPDLAIVLLEIESLFA